ncbi:hypothetical protein [Rhizobium sp. LjRoot254]|uniref:hypothetical protein n=1 Tax=Rhizobium sp. LjRoot254 TaxID=3342297 RepID=UPI003ED0592B
MEIDQRIRLLLSSQRALLDAVTPNIRAVRCAHKGNIIFIEFIFEADFSEEDFDRCEVVATEVISDYSDAMIDTRFTVLPPPACIPHDESSVTVYRRFEQFDA